jgi:hypothetical protein
MHGDHWIADSGLLVVQIHLQITFPSLSPWVSSSDDLIWPMRAINTYEAQSLERILVPHLLDHLPHLFVALFPKVMHGMLDPAAHDQHTSATISLRTPSSPPR